MRANNILVSGHTWFRSWHNKSQIYNLQFLADSGTEQKWDHSRLIARLNALNIFLSISCFSHFAAGFLNIYCHGGGDDEIHFQLWEYGDQIIDILEFPALPAVVGADKVCVVKWVTSCRWWSTLTRFKDTVAKLSDYNLFQINGSMISFCMILSSLTQTVTVSI